MNPNISKETWTSASDTIGGATSADVHTGYGLPEGQASTELHGNGATKGKKEELGLAGLSGGADKFNGTLDNGRPQGADSATEQQEDFTGAEDKLPTSAEEVASEFPGR